MQDVPTREIKSRIAMAKTTFNNKKTLSTSTRATDLRNKLVKSCVWSITVYGTGTWTLRKVDQKYLGSFSMWCCRRMEKLIWIDRVKNGEVLRRVKEERNVLDTIKRREANWIGRILCRKYLLNLVTVRQEKHN